jgi:hypothetical protein
MDKIMEIVKWFQSNWLNICSVITSIIGTASIIVKMTPNLKDDTILLNIIKFLGKYIALNKNTPTDAERPK